MCIGEVLFMKNVLFLFLIITISVPTFASYSCECELEFKKEETGELYTEEVSVDCPETTDSSTLSCDGDEFAGTLTSTCTNSENGESNSESGWTQLDAEPTSPWPSCSLW